MALRDRNLQAVTQLGALVIDQRAFNGLLEEPSAAGSAFRHLLLSSMTRQLTTANQKIRDLITDMEKEEATQKEAKASEAKTLDPKISTQPSSSDRLLQIAGVLDGWTIETEGISDVEFYEDEDMKRTREARGRALLGLFVGVNVAQRLQHFRFCVVRLQFSGLILGWPTIPATSERRVLLSVIRSPLRESRTEEGRSSLGSVLS